MAAAKAGGPTVSGGLGWRADGDAPTRALAAAWGGARAESRNGAGRLAELIAPPAWGAWGQAQLVGPLGLGVGPLVRMPARSMPARSRCGSTRRSQLQWRKAHLWHAPLATQGGALPLATLGRAGAARGSRFRMPEVVGVRARGKSRRPSMQWATRDTDVRELCRAGRAPRVHKCKFAPAKNTKVNRRVLSRRTFQNFKRSWRSAAS